MFILFCLDTSDTSQDFERKWREQLNFHHFFTGATKQLWAALHKNVSKSHSNKAVRIACDGSENEQIELVLLSSQYDRLFAKVQSCIG